MAELLDEHKLQDALRNLREVRQKRAFGGGNWPFYYEMNKFKNSCWQGVRTFPNLREINAEEFAAHPCISGSYSPNLLSSANVEHMEGIKFARYAKVLMLEVQCFAGYGVAFVAVPADENDWNRSQSYSVPLKLRHWSFHLCDHEYGYGKNVGNCSNDYSCKKCGWTYNVDSSG